MATTHYTPWEQADVSLFLTEASYGSALYDSRGAWAERDLALFKKRAEARYALSAAMPRTPLEGDWVEDHDGTMRRIAYTDPSTTQFDSPKFGSSFHCFANGAMDFSGGLDSPIPTASLEATGNFEPATCWIFSGDSSGAHRGVRWSIPVRVWRVKR